MIALEQHPSPMERILVDQQDLYEGAFYRHHRWRWVFRDDCRYRKNRFLEVLSQLGVAAERACVFELGFGTGDLLFQFPTGCSLMGVELSHAAVEAIQSDPRVRRYRNHWFRPLLPDGSLPVPPRPVDLAIASHVLEHVPDDRAVVEQMVPLLRAGGHLAIFVPIEPPGFDPKHVRTYDVASASRLLQNAGLEVVHAEENYHVRSGPLRWLDHPARFDWPVLKSLEGIRDLLMTLLPYRATRGIEELLEQAGVRGTQAMVIGRR